MSELKSKLNGLLDQLNFDTPFSKDNSENLQNIFMKKTQRILSSLSQISLNSNQRQTVNETFEDNRSEFRESKKLGNTLSSYVDPNKGRMTPNANEEDLDQSYKRLLNNAKFKKAVEKPSDDFEDFNFNDPKKVEASNRNEGNSVLSEFEEQWSKININKDTLLSNKSERILKPKSVVSQSKPVTVNATPVRGCQDQVQNKNENKNREIPRKKADQEGFEQFFGSIENNIDALRRNIRGINSKEERSANEWENRNNQSFESGKFNLSFGNGYTTQSSNLNRAEKSFLKTHNEMNEYSNNNFNNSNFNLTNKIQNLYQNIINCEINLGNQNNNSGHRFVESKSTSRLEKFNEVISPSNMNRDQKKKVKESEEDTYGINKEFLRRLVSSRNPPPRSKQDKSKIKQKFEENQNLIELYFKNNSNKPNSKAGQHEGDIFRKNNFEDFYNRVTYCSSAKNLN